MKSLTLLAALFAAACMTTVGGTERDTMPPDTSERVEIRLGERYVDPGGGLEIQPTLIEVNRAVFVVRVNGIAREIALTTGSLGSETVPPYTFQLVSTSITPSATVLIERRR